MAHGLPGTQASLRAAIGGVVHDPAFLAGQSPSWMDPFLRFALLSKREIASSLALLAMTDWRGTLPLAVTRRKKVDTLALEGRGFGVRVTECLAALISQSRLPSTLNMIIFLHRSDPGS